MYFFIYLSATYVCLHVYMSMHSCLSVAFVFVLKIGLVVMVVFGGIWIP